MHASKELEDFDNSDLKSQMFYNVVEQRNRAETLNAALREEVKNVKSLGALMGSFALAGWILCVIQWMVMMFG